MISSFLRSFAFGACFLVIVGVTGCSGEARKARSKERASAALAAGELEKAKVEYMSLVQRGKGDAEVMGQLGLIWSLQGSGIPAGRFFAEARRRGVLSVPLRVRLVFAFMGLGDTAGARDEAQTILKMDPANGEALLMMAQTARTPEEEEATSLLIDTFPNRNSAAFHLASVPFLMRAGKVLDAEDAVAKALAAEPESVVAHLTAGSLRLGRNDLAGAEQAIKKGSELAPVRSPERMKLAEFKAQQGQMEEAKQLVAGILEKAPDYVPALMMSAQIAGTSKDVVGGLAILDKIFAIDVDNIGARLLQSELLMSNNESARAVEVLQRLDQVYAGQPVVRLQLARRQLQIGELAAAAAVLADVLKARPEFVEAALLQAEVNLRAGNPAAVVTAMQALLVKDPKSEPATFFMVQALEAQRRFDEALRGVYGLLQLRPENPEYYARLGSLLWQTGQVKEARGAYEKVLALVPGEMAAMTRLVDLDLAEDKSEAALARVAALRASDPTSAFAAFTEGRIYLAREDLPKAETALLKALEISPNNLGANDLLIRLYASTRQLPQALQKCEERLAANPKDEGALRLLGIIANLLGDHQKSVEAYERLLAVVKTPDVPLLNNLATLYVDYFNNLDAAFDMARQARSLQPTVAGALTPEAKSDAAFVADTLGWVLYRRGDFPQAFALAQEAVTQIPDHPEIQAHFGLAAAAMGQTEVARKALEAAVAGPDDFTAKAEARQRLALISGEATLPKTSVELAALAGAGPNDPLLQQRLAEALEQEKKFPEAAAAYAAALERNPGLLAAALRLTDLYAGPLQNPARAIEFARKARELARSDRAVAGQLGGLVYQAGDHAWAYDLLREATQGGEKNAVYLVSLGRAAYSLGRVAEARAAMESALAAGPEPSVAAEATDFLELTAVPGADAARIEVALARDARHVPALFGRAAVEEKAGQAAAATATCEEILKIYPSFTPAQKQLAVLLAADPASRTRAYDLVVKARKEWPADADLAETLGQLSYHRKDYRYAVDLLQEAAKTKASGPQAWFTLGRSQLALGQKDAARESLTQAVATGLTGADAAEATTVLKDLK